MMDFTKEELEEIFWIIEGSTMEHVGKEGNDLLNKIQSMIDNYNEPCKHKNLCRVRLIDGHEYDICPHCAFRRQVR